MYAPIPMQTHSVIILYFSMIGVTLAVNLYMNTFFDAMLTKKRVFVA